jgi:hypothetical protein
MNNYQRTVPCAPDIGPGATEPFQRHFNDARTPREPGFDGQPPRFDRTRAPDEYSDELESMYWRR